MRVFLDTNVLVSAFLGSQLCDELLRRIVDEHHLVVSELVIAEYERVLRNKFKASDSDLAEALTLLRKSDVVSRSSVPTPNGITASNDLIIILDAHDANVDFLVTGDHEMLEQATNFGVSAVSPRGFLELVEGSDERYPPFPDEGEGPLVSEPQESPIKEKSFQFALDTISLYQQLQDQREYVISKQLLRSGTSIGANVEEATAAESRRDFLHKMNVASKEARETNYWLRLLRDSNLAERVEIEPHLTGSYELVKMLTAIVKTTART